MGCGASKGVKHPLRAPIFSKKASSKVDSHAYSKYCSDAIAASWFKTADSDGSGTIDFEEFTKTEIAKGLSRDDALRLFKSADADDNGHIDYTEFLAALNQPSSPLAKAAVKIGLLSEKGSKNNNTADDQVSAS
mmetsp:Transcript_31607/g.84543  ORF Transcript_31607/g.84543 Transcript_31607/m.84543 type:complete len:134 (+) Transcript_31607:19-420(+)